MNPLPILLDTDIGDDIDDALAVTIALNSPELNLVGVTTVFRDAPRRAILARELMQRMNRENVPIFAGCSEPLLPAWDTLPGGKQVGRQMELLEAGAVWNEPTHAVHFLIEQARLHQQRGETLTIVTIGAMTNLALALRLDPDLASRCRIVAMGGCALEPYAEWNILCDPEAAAMVFGSGADITMVGLDVTTKCVLSDAQVQQFRDSPHAHANWLGQLIDLWGHAVTLHDPLTVLTLFESCVEFEPMRIAIPLCGEHRAEIVAGHGEPNCRVAVRVDAERAKALFMERVGV